MAVDIAGHLFALELQQLHQHPQLKDYVGHSILAGLRPEAFYRAEVRDTTQSFHVTVETVEALGHEMMVYFDAAVAKVEVEEHSEESDSTKTYQTANPTDPHSTLIARMPSSKDIRAGVTLALAVDTSKLYLFDLQGKAIALS